LNAIAERWQVKQVFFWGGLFDFLKFFWCPVVEMNFFWLGVMFYPEEDGVESRENMGNRDSMGDGS
jgi:hypothetical protein